MSIRPIMDAGPGLNFFSINQERLLFNTVGPVHMPEIVTKEIVRKSRTDSRFDAAEKVLNKLPERLLQVLPDDYTEDLENVVMRISEMGFHQRYRDMRDLGKTMVIAHAVVAAESGADVIVLIDEREGTAIAASEQARLQRLRQLGREVGSISLANTVMVLKSAVMKGFISDKADIRRLYERLRALDDGLMPINSTGLLDAQLWSTRKDPKP